MLFIAFLLPIQILQAAQSEEFSSPEFRQYLTNEGLADSTVYAIMQDSLGFMWFGTVNGLSRYDGHKFTNFLAKSDTNSISNNMVYAIIEDKQGFIWIATSHGLNRFDPRSETFKHYFHEKGNKNSLRANDIRSLLEDSDGELWIGTSGGLHRYHSDSDDFMRIALPGDNNLSSLLSIQDIHEDQQGKLWFSTFDSGIFSFNKTNNIARKLSIDLENIQVHFRPDQINEFWIDEQNRLWVATRSGLIEHHINTGDLNFHLYHEQKIRLNSVLGSSKESLWLSTSGQGLCEFNVNTYKWRCFDGGLDQFPARSTKAIYQASQGILWVGTQAEGVISFKPDNPFRIIRFDEPYNRVHDIEQDREGRLWFGSASGAVRLDQNKEIKIYTHQANISTSLNNNFIYDIKKDHAHRLWIATSGGLNEYNYKNDHMDRIDLGKPDNSVKKGIMHIQPTVSGELFLATAREYFIEKWNPALKTATKFIFSEQTPEGLRTRNLFGSFIDSKNKLWLLGHEYIAYLDEKKQRITPTEFSANTAKNYIKMAEDLEGRLWVTAGNELHEVSRQGKIIRIFGKDYFADGMLLSVVSAGENLWISASDGIWRFNTKTHQTKRYIKEDGLANSDFFPADFVDKTGTIYMGGVDGTTVFHPDSFKNISQFEPVVRLTDLRMNNVPVAVNNVDNNILPQAISYTQNLELDYEQSRAFSLEFSAQDYFSPSRNQYAYRLKGLTDTWTFTDTNNRLAAYTALSAGTYLFEVKASATGSEWSENVTELKIQVLPPWWLSYWAYAFYILSGILILSLFVRYRTSLAHNRAKLLEKEVALRTQQIQEQKHTIESMLEKKNLFFTNVSHELRTPLTLVLGPISSLLRKTKDPSLQKELSIAQRNTQRLTHLVDKLLDFARLNQTSPAQEKLQSLSKVIEVLCAATNSQFADKDIQFELHNVDNIWVQATPADAIETIVINLLSNAYKYTPNGGHVCLTLEPIGTEQAKLTIENTGQAIPEDIKENLFERFYRMPEHEQSDISGSGLGLALVKELTLANQGHITVTNSQQDTICFTLTLPCLRTDKDTSEYIPNQSHNWRIEDPSFSPEYTPYTETPAHSARINEGDEDDRVLEQNTILVIDDTRDMLTYIESELSAEYTVITAHNGENGLNSAQENLPDLVICDLMMPGINGFEVLDKFRNNIITSHIPFILLTAKNDNESRIRGLQASADDYITKPFNTQVLLARIKGLLGLRELLSKNHSQILLANSTLSALDKSQLSNKDREFLSNFYQLIVAEYAKPEFSSKDILQALHISERALQKKIKALLGCTTVQYLRDFRLEQAAKFLLQDHMSLSEVIYASGFSSQQYFNRCFKQYFGESPLVYQKHKES